MTGFNALLYNIYAKAKGFLKVLTTVPAISCKLLRLILEYASPI